MQNKIVIIGAGLTGLTLAYLLKKRNINALILEADSKIGGRIQTINGINNTKIEMGATWFGDHHLHLKNLILELNLKYFKQFTKGVSLFETDSMTAPQRFEIPTNEEEPSYRIIGGTNQLINTLADKLDTKQIELNSKIINITEKGDELILLNDQGKLYKAYKVVTTLPPNLLINSIKFVPNFLQEEISIFNKTHTWMGESIKFAVEYAQPFWKGKGYSGTIFSNINIIQEQYDHSGFNENSFALKGFLNASSINISKEERKGQVISQLMNLLGNEAENYLDYHEKIWQFDELVFKPYTNYVLPHQNNGNAVYQKSFMQGKLFLSGTETSTKYGGYMDGAVSAALLINDII